MAQTLAKWSPYQALTQTENAVFERAMKGFVGVVYTPHNVSCQQVAGNNYRFKCAASMPPSGILWEAVVEIYQPLEGKPYVVSIQRI